MRDSIIQDMQFSQYDFLDGTPNVSRHHVLHGTANRKCADEDGLWVALTPAHHTDTKCSAHHCIIMNTLLEIVGQLAWEKHYIAKGNEFLEREAREAFRKRYGKSFL